MYKRKFCFDIQCVVLLLSFCYVLVFRFSRFHVAFFSSLFFWLPLYRMAFKPSQLVRFFDFLRSFFLSFRIVLSIVYTYTHSGRKKGRKKTHHNQSKTKEKKKKPNNNKRNEEKRKIGAKQVGKKTGWTENEERKKKKRMKHYEHTIWIYRIFNAGRYLVYMCTTNNSISKMCVSVRCCERVCVFI